MFVGYTYPPSSYHSYTGLDNTALLGSSVATNEMFTIVGSNGYSERDIFKIFAIYDFKIAFPIIDIFEGIVHVYTHSGCSWTLQSYIRSPVGDNGNFGVSVAIYGERIVVGANSWGKLPFFPFHSDQLIFYYSHQLNIRAKSSYLSSLANSIGCLRLLSPRRWACSTASASLSPCTATTQSWAPAAMRVRMSSLLPHFCVKLCVSFCVRAGFKLGMEPQHATAARSGQRGQLRALGVGPWRRRSRGRGWLW